MGSNGSNTNPVNISEEIIKQANFLCKEIEELNNKIKVIENSNKSEDMKKAEIKELDAKITNNKVLISECYATLRNVAPNLSSKKIII